MGRQHDEDKVEQKKSEVRMSRWYNRLLNRHQDDPVSRVLLHTYNNKHHYILTLSLFPPPPLPPLLIHTACVDGEA